MAALGPSTQPTDRQGNVSSGGHYQFALGLAVVPRTEAALCFFQPLHELVVCLQLRATINGLLRAVIRNHNALCTSYAVIKARGTNSTLTAVFHVGFPLTLSFLPALVPEENLLR